MITYPVGALFCASEALRCGFIDRVDWSDRWRVELNYALAASKALSRGEQPSEVKFSSVVHFNSALHRIDVGFERLIRHQTKCSSIGYEALAKEARKLGVPDSTLDSWSRVRKGEVNRLKHKDGGGLLGPRITFCEMLESLDALVDQLEIYL